jgi:hypothetical protein
MSEIAEVDILEDIGIVDESTNDETVAPERYDITSFGADYDVDGLVRRLNRGDIFIPDFQRDYVWKIPEASRFIESLLLGLPVPGIFLARERETNRLLVIDGQQRLKTLQFFYSGYFNPQHDDKKQRVFALTKVQARFEGKTYSTLEEHDRIKLDNSIIHATVVKQEVPDDDDTSIYHIFERLNNGGRKLMPQEIRVALYHGPFVEMLNNLNQNPFWRQIYGKENNRLKDHELILRFLALYFDLESYRKPMAEFLNRFLSRHFAADQEVIHRSATIFDQTIELMFNALGTSAFRPERSLNAAVFDSVMVGLAKRIATLAPLDEKKIASAYATLLDNFEYQSAISSGTSDERSVITRITRAISAFANV